MRTANPHRIFSGLAWAAGFGVAGWALAWLGRYPFLRIDWADPSGWLQAADPESAIAAIARTIGIGLVGWVGATTVAYLLARLLGADPAALDWLSIGPVRKAIDAVLAGSLVITTLTPIAAAATEEPVPHVETTEFGGSAVAPSYIPIPAGDPDATDAGAPASPPADTPTTEPAPAAAATSAIVISGDNLWKLAEDRLTTVLGHHPTDAETALYWVDVIQANRDRIRSADPDLIFPGEEIVLPAVSPAGLDLPPTT